MITFEVVPSDVNVISTFINLTKVQNVAYLNISLVKELACNLLRHHALYLPGFGDCWQVTSSDHHGSEQGSVICLLPIGGGVFG